MIYISSEGKNVNTSTQLWLDCHQCFQNLHHCHNRCQGSGPLHHQSPRPLAQVNQDSAMFQTTLVNHLARKTDDQFFPHELMLQIDGMMFAACTCTATKRASSDPTGHHTSSTHTESSWKQSVSKLHLHPIKPQCITRQSGSRHNGGQLQQARLEMQESR